MVSWDFFINFAYTKDKAAIMNKRTLFAIAFASTIYLQSFGWGQKGHDTTAYIAEQHLTEATKAACEGLFDGRSIVYYSNWMDNASHTPAYAHTKTWHYKNINEGQRYEDVKPFKTGDVVTALNEQIAVLNDTLRNNEERSLALKYVVHLMGDVHQPMHTGHATDLGGNKVYIKSFGKPTNLHSLWDAAIVENAHKWSYTEWQQQIDRAGDDYVKEIVVGGTPDSWCRDTAVLGAEVYKNTPEGSDVSYDYFAYWAPMVEDQLLRGGLRLADILNSIFDPTYIPLNGMTVFKR